MLQCYNRGCGQTYDPNDNNDESCRHHPGVPFFHDAYKGWSCCKKKSVDFTEFLNTKGCTLSQHSNIKPAEPEKPEKPETENDVPVQQEIRQPIKNVETIRPDFNSPVVKIIPNVAAALKEAIDGLRGKTGSQTKTTPAEDGEIPVGTLCNNRGCGQSYKNSAADYSDCQHHPGVAIFHEGLKYWSCCQKRTSDFSAFLAQVGCTNGLHKWFKDDDDKKVVNCRYDWHQTPTNVTVAIYAKMYHYERSTVQVNPIRLSVRLVFPEQNDDLFNLDLELRGLIKVSQTTVHMYGTKVEITMPKAEPGTWAKLNFPRPADVSNEPLNTQVVDTQQADNSDSDFDLDDIENISGGFKLADIS